jgi:hypothetical protein
MRAITMNILLYNYMDSWVNLRQFEDLEVKVDYFVYIPYFGGIVFDDYKHAKLTRKLKRPLHQGFTQEI